MLRSLDITDLLIIDRLELGFQSGLNVLTGETGAGKSILLDALGFVLGWRGRAALVRKGAAQGEVTAVFDLPAGHAAHQVLEEAGIPTEEGELILRRVNSTDGRKTAWVNSVRVSGEVLRALSDHLVELHGQQDDRGLLNPRGHRDLLDDFAATAPLRDATRRAWSARRAAQSRLDDLRAAAEALRQEEEFLRHAVAEFDALAPEPGEEDRLDAERRLMQAAERIREDISKAHAAITGDGAEGMVRDATRWLDDAADVAEGRLDSAIDALSRAMEALGEAEQGIAETLDALSFDVHALETTEERLFAIRALARKHGQLSDDLPAFADSLRERLTALDASEGDIAGAEASLARAEAEYAAAAEALSAARTKAARKLETAMAEELAPLKMERAVFEVSIAEGSAGPDGRDDVRFLVATNPGAPAGALDKIASGGELSRFLLALKVCLTQDVQGLTMIFDEIDRGVGGATADAVGRRLKALAEGGQVLVVTHSPQVAALGGHHWRVEKAVSRKDGEEITTSRVLALAPEERIDEIARMLAGDRITDAARGAAKELLAATPA
ncbi:DNA repair protein RecN [Ponticoccus sp. SC2-23]|uniref:DNA repair protein RecN n=1 Tax=Alexandriicola marinus TaxID=2081710 RepID=UPI000FDC87C9|nr:DNA repair protein RecN [Alexandriicola marinus]MBM1219475.1 DNA repair protein RecN [Ponticoccus sp. SC6-9]MBM1223453.1 DNA repair protein RecN [Ponticoccus sp. SC6-15]MBM1229288.1 DNA repair protein RecN [Ponticoccus sp. SC6-38]MBM1232419.1 DNA repair protein RecN [Ponticoccus sp. SC6-45]MBM1237631.1 DNA repair protein RecN [Ponticoccus sp. SC6-49]MBM1241430.1 DNA repair protein RecN [Ponticoccus sp. SC2-64]MBM1245943.1 DNA repair protein RecN [Ponticoccus sp. SC6-42]MBM1250421.1 DNA r